MTCNRPQPHNWPNLVKEGAVAQKQLNGWHPAEAGQLAWTSHQPPGLVAHFYVVLMPMSPSPMMYQEHAGGARQMYHGLVDSINDFAEHTSAHGIPRAFSSKTCLKKCLWLLLFFVCLTAFIVQAYQIVMRFFRNDIIVGVELKFENIPFPSVTVCNNNPYKNSLARTMGSVRDTLLAFDDAMGRSNTASSSTQLNQEPEILTN
uniref:Uncharacterized protein n=1 Tax=Ditylenchus dipsaci TaxID=166011 RepID=A0A915EQN1_9BILA